MKNLDFCLPINSSLINVNSFDIIKKQVFSFIKNNPKDFVENWDCNTLSNIKNKNKFKSKLLEDVIKTEFNSYFKKFSPDNNFKVRIRDLWINISSKGSFQEIHNHTNFENPQCISGTLYIKSSKDSGNLILINPMGHLAGYFPTCLSFSDLRIEPIERLLVLFPSFLMHRVGINKTSQSRISVSFNIEATPI